MARSTIVKYIKSGYITAVKFTRLVYDGTVVPKEKRVWPDKSGAPYQRSSRWKIPVSEVERLLTKMYNGEKLPPGLMKRFRRKAKPKPPSY